MAHLKHLVFNFKCIIAPLQRPHRLLDFAVELFAPWHRVHIGLRPGIHEHVGVGDFPHLAAASPGLAAGLRRAEPGAHPHQGVLRLLA